MRGVVERDAARHGVKRGFQGCLRRGRVDGIRHVDEAAVGRGVGRFRQTPVMQGLVGINEHALLGEGKVDRTTLDVIPAIITARTAQGSDLQVGIRWRAASNHIGGCRVGRHVRKAVGSRGKSHQVRLQVLVGKRHHIDGGRQ